MLSGCGGPKGVKVASNYSIDRSHVKDDHGNFRGPPFETMQFWGKPFLMLRWSSSCATCDEQLASLNALAADGKIPVIILNNDPVTKPDALSPLVASHGFTAVHAVRSKSELQHALQKDIDSNMFQATEPGMVLLYNGKIQGVWAMTGVADFKSPDVQKLIAEAK
jgi:thiol-disulfide isomerase/thioredoxin